VNELIIAFAQLNFKLRTSNTKHQTSNIKH